MDGSEEVLHDQSADMSGIEPLSPLLRMLPPSDADADEAAMGDARPVCQQLFRDQLAVVDSPEFHDQTPPERDISGVSMDHELSADEPTFSLQPVVHERDEPLSANDPDIEFSENTEADQYVMQPEADQSEIAAVGHAEPRPVVVGRSDFTLDYNDHMNEDNVFDGSVDQDELLSGDESQSDMPEDNLNFVNRQIEGEDDDEEGSVRSASSRAHSSLAQSDQNFPGEMSSQRLDLVGMPQRIPPSGAADGSRQLSVQPNAPHSPALSPVSHASQRLPREAVLGATATEPVRRQPVQQPIHENRATRPKEPQNSQRRQTQSRTIPKAPSSSNSQPIMGTASLKPESTDTECRRDFRNTQLQYHQEQQQLAAQLRNLQLQHQSIQRPLEVNVFAQHTPPKKPRDEQNMSPLSQHMASPGASSALEALHNVSMGSVFSDTRVKESNEILRMDQVRGQLAHMMSMSNAPERNTYDQCNASASVSDNHGNINDSLLMTDITSQLGEMLSFTSQQLRSNSSYSAPNHMKRGTAELLAENHSLQASLEEEKYRRKHCEKQIQQLQTKLLEVQQQLAVCISTDRKKDLMIEQLDKTLAKLVENWRRKEIEKNEQFRALSCEHEQLRAKESQQLKLISQFESQLTETINQLHDQQQQAASNDHQNMQRMQLLEQELAVLREAIASERQLSTKAQEEAERTQQELDVTSRDLEEIRLQQAEDRESWEEREREYLQRVQDMTDNHLQLMEDAKKKHEDQSRKAQELQKNVHSMSLELQQRLLDLEAVIREKESMKVEMGILEAKGEAALRKMEADLQSQAEKELSSRLNEAHTRYSQSEEELRERHRKQLAEMSQNQSQELQDQRNRSQEELKRNQDKWKSQAQTYEDRLEALQKDIEEAKQFNRVLEEQRQEITDKLQGMMQSHCNETLRLLQLNSQALQTPAFVHMGPLIVSRELSTPVVTSSADASVSVPATTVSCTNSLPPNLEFNHLPVTKTVTFQEPLEQSLSPEPPSMTASPEENIEIAEKDAAASSTPPRNSSPITSSASHAIPFTSIFSSPRHSSSVVNPILLHSPVTDMRTSVDLPRMPTNAMAAEQIQPQRDLNEAGSTARGTLLSSILQQPSSLNSSLVSDAASQQEPERLLSQMDTRFEEHEQRQSELQYYINLLLSRPPGSASSKENSPQNTSNQPQEVTPPRQEQLQAFTKTTLAAQSDPPKVLAASSPQSTLLSPQQVGEISRLLGLYHGNQAEKEATKEPPARELFSYLQTLQSNHIDSNQPTHDQSITLAKQNKSNPLQETHVIHIPTGAEKSDSSLSRPATSSSSSNKLKKTSKAAPAKKPERKTTQHSEQKSKNVWK